MLKEMGLMEILLLVIRHLNLWVMSKICLRYAWNIFKRCDMPDEYLRNVWDISTCFIYAQHIDKIRLRTASYILVICDIREFSVRNSLNNPLICQRQYDCFVTNDSLTFTFYDAF